MIASKTLYAWSRLFAIAAAYFAERASECTPGSQAYLEYLDLARDCEDAGYRAADEADAFTDPELRAMLDSEARP